ncbi:hypothetical protein EW026_g7977 [Hermanssonia centrifuga]|uniref:ABC-2 type transporter transmembrane domain-containing protein n=1 Tax=Hermanssonia centrifuga TaxID=98765 RepID=A0A4S4K617_9APHY|nr:hypothetical protein EW026_g7977 [Hermanssonia centrifuga]
MADNIMVMAKYGNVIYQGPREGLLPHLSLAGYQCPPLYNPADFCMDLVSVGSGFEMEQLENIARIKELINCWKTYEDKSADTRIHKQIGGEAAVSPEHVTESVSVYSALPVILERTLRNTWRQSDLFWTRWIQAPFLAILFFIFFLRLTKGPAGAQDRIGLVAECTSIVAFVGFLNVVTIYPMEKNKFFHDFSTAGGRYSTGTFILAFSLFAVIPELISAIIFTLIMNLATGMQTNARIFFEFTIAIWVQLNFGESIGIAFSSFFDTMGLSVSLVSVFLSVAAQSSGIFSASIVKFLADLAWIFPVKYLPRILLINEMQGLVFDCSSDSILSGECTAASGEQVLALFGFHDEPWRLLLISLAITFAYRVAAWAVLAMRMRYVK